jgi:hypothetical protein
MSGDPRIKIWLKSLNEDERYEFEERAAIIQFDGGLRRDLAEWEAYRQLRKPPER